MIAPRFTPAVCAEIDAIVRRLLPQMDGGALRLYSGQRPPATGDSPAGVLLAELRLSDPAFQEPVDGVAEARAIRPTKGLATGTASWWRIVDADGQAVLDGSIGPGGGLTLNHTAVAPNLDLSIGRFTCGIRHGGQA